MLPYPPPLPKFNSYPLEKMVLGKRLPFLLGPGSFPIGYSMLNFGKVTRYDDFVGSNLEAGCAAWGGMRMQRTKKRRKPRKPKSIPISGQFTIFHQPRFFVK